MRLGQLARKLSLRPSQLVDFLAEKNIQSEEGSNTRLTDEYTQVIIEHFAPERLEEIMKPVVEEISRPEPVIEENTVIEENRIIEEIAEPVAEVEVIVNQQPESEPEVIRVQKIELSGLKVLGKIDLPEPKKKEPKPESENPEEGAQKPERKGILRSKPPKRERTWKNPLDVQRQREARDLEEKRKAEFEREKERRKNHYQTKVKQVSQPKRNKPVKQVVTAKKQIDTRPVPKTWFGKFLRWWTS